MQHNPAHYYIRILEDGSFQNVRDHSLYIEQGSLVRVILQLRSSELEPLALIKRHDAAKKKKYDISLKEQLYGTRHAELPLKVGKAFLKEAFTVVELQTDEQGDYYCEVRFNKAGSQFYRLIYMNQQGEIVRLGFPNYFLVQPKNNLEQVTIQTVLPYSLGHLSKWKEQLVSQIQVGYKAFHFPPIQKLGSSGSLYSIADQNQLNPDLLPDIPEQEFGTFLKELNKRHGTLFFVDILLNHTAFDSEWLNKPEFKDAIYSPENTPSLNCAIELDKAIGNFSNAIAKKEVPQYPFGNRIENEHQLGILMNILEHDILKPLKLEEFFELDIEKVLSELQQKLGHSIPESSSQIEADDDDDNIFIKDPRELFKQNVDQNLSGAGCARKGLTLKMNEIISFLKTKDNYKKISLEYMRHVLEGINEAQLQKANGYIREALNSTFGQIKWEHIERGKHEIIYTDKGDSLVPRYFTQLKNGTWAANNGWIADFDPLLNFAESPDHHYFRRTIIVWGDLVKLRYGASKRDSPALWKYMKRYVHSMAKMFHGLRLDNAHSTPLHVGGYMMRKARQMNEKILIFAELFTGSSFKDSKFTKQLGLNCLVREVNRCFTGGDLCGALYFYSGSGKHAIGSLPQLTERYNDKDYTLLRPGYCPALVYEQSHDNESLIASHGHKHLLPIAALLAFAKCMKGTVRGYDQYFKDSLSVVSERRIYEPPTSEIKTTQEEIINVQFRIDLPKYSNLVEIRGSFDGWSKGYQLFPLQDGPKNSFTTSINLPKGGYEYRYLVEGEWINPADKEYNHNGNHYIDVGVDTVRVYSSLVPVRQKLATISANLEEHYPQIHVESHHNSVVSIYRFSDDLKRSRVIIAQPQFSDPYNFPVIELPGRLHSVDHIFSTGDNIQFNHSNETLKASVVEITEHHNLLKYCEIYYNYEKRIHILKFVKLPVSTVIILTCQQEQMFSDSITKLSEINFQNSVCDTLTTNDINFLLFSSEHEEFERTQAGLYHIPNYRRPVYAGIYGFLPAIHEAQQDNNLSHPICENLRNGNWLLDYIDFRLSKNQSHSSEKLRAFVNEVIALIKQAPKYLSPYYFSVFLNKLSDQVSKAIEKRSNVMIRQSPFFRQLGIAAYQFVAELPSASFSPYKYSFSAGHPHFTTGWARSWGRDTFIAFKGCMILTGMVDQAKEILFQYAACMRHGLLPNLLDAGNNSRFNNRDACWWFIKALKDYIDFSGDHDIWKAEIQMQFLDDDIERHYKKKEQGVQVVRKLQDIVQHILESHANGIQFREWRAGSEIDKQMESEGFNIFLKMDEQTGFIVGGNYRNCLTWMDKMGSSDRAKNKGFPATSRDGAPIEMTALLKLALDFLHRENQSKHYEFDSVMYQNRKLTFKNWSETIQQNFEKNYWVPRDQDKYPEYNINPYYVRYRQIYKDLAKSSKPRNDYQLRCNACIAIAIAPELFTKTNAQFHLATTEAVLLEPLSLGIKTLDKNSTEYVPYYDNSDDSDSFKIAHGFSYHNGPEWVWVYGYFLRALIQVHNMSPNVFFSYLTNHKKFLGENEWVSLPELTNANGQPNNFSCPAQAWSIGVILEAIGDFSLKHH